MRCNPQAVLPRGLAGGVHLFLGVKDVLGASRLERVLAGHNQLYAVDADVLAAADERPHRLRPAAMIDVAGFDAFLSLRAAFDGRTDHPRTGRRSSFDLALEVDLQRVGEGTRRIDAGEAV